MVYKTSNIQKKTDHQAEHQTAVLHARGQDLAVA